MYIKKRENAQNDKTGFSFALLELPKYTPAVSQHGS